MSMVIPFSKCIARPRTETRPRQKLMAHLLEVAHMAGTRDGPIVERLLFLAGLVHDAGKATYEWQEYILRKEKGLPASPVPHAHVGSCLFFWAALEIVTSLEISPSERQDAVESILWLTTDIASHHGVLSDISDQYPPWEPALARDMNGRLLADTDLATLVDFVDCEMGDIGLTSKGFDEWFGDDGGRGCWARTVVRAFGGQTSFDGPILSAARELVRMNTSKLIYADRMNAAGDRDGDESLLSSDLASHATLEVIKYCSARQSSRADSSRASRQLGEQRGVLQKQSLDAYLSNQHHSMFSLQLPTGMGKTICSLRIALSAVESGRCRRIIYVAPYLSILSNATRELRDSTKILEIMQHDSVTRLDALVREANESASDQLVSDQAFDLLALESWNAPVITTTFNQFFRALFPRTAQQTMRIKALENSFIIMDELQSIDTAKWKLFLTMLEALTSRVNAQVLLITATLPDTEGGLSTTPIELGNPFIHLSRYGVEWDPNPIDLKRTAETAVSAHKAGTSVAVILNTIQDAYEVYREVLRISGYDPDCGQNEPDDVMVLSGLMTPLHKDHRIETIKDFMKERSILLVCTQVLEAGVDLSFDLIIRAIAPLPFLIQAAGRVNRHNERGRGLLKVINYVRSDGTDTSLYIYDRNDLELTRSMLDELGTWDESRSKSLCSEFYRRSFQRAQREALLSCIDEARLGAWSRLGGLEPFGGSRPMVPVFVAREVSPIRENVKTAMELMGVSSPAELWEIYTAPERMKGMSFAQRRGLLALLQFFTVPVSDKLASTAHFCQVGDKPFLRLTDEDVYRGDTGLMHLVKSDDPTFQ
ncbi:MAG: CRISPR-associated helicase Cas3' [Bacillota bacterium]|jgi:CRISPR-associated endonuclease/helicase Cas3